MAKKKLLVGQKTKTQTSTFVGTSMLTVGVFLFSMLYGMGMLAAVAPVDIQPGASRIVEQASIAPSYGSAPGSVLSASALVSASAILVCQGWAYDVDPCPIVIDIPSPAPNQTVSGPAEISFAASAPDGIRQVKVSLVTKNFTSVIYTSDDPAGSFTFDFSRFPSGSYQLNFRAFSTGMKESTRSRQFFVQGLDVPADQTTDPKVTFLEPRAQAVIKGTFTVVAEVIDPIGIVNALLDTKVGFFRPSRTEYVSESQTRLSWDLSAQTLGFGDQTLKLQVQNALGRSSPEISLRFKTGSSYATQPWLANQKVTYDDQLAKKNAGRILLQVQRNGEAWYVYPKNNKRYYLGGGEAAVSLMRKLGLGVKNAVLNEIPIAGTNATGNMKTRQRLKGYILIQVEKKGEAWYVNPTDLKRYYLGRASQAYALMRKLGQPISNQQIAKIQPERPITVTNRIVKTKRGSFRTTYVKIDMRNNAYRIMTDTASPGTCGSNCAGLSMSDYAFRRGAIAAINGSYFCPPDYGCGGASYTFSASWFNSFSGQYANPSNIENPYLPYYAFDTTNRFYRYPNDGTKSEPTIQSDMQAALTARGGSGDLQAAFMHGPELVRDKAVGIDSLRVDAKMKVKSSRMSMGIKGSEVFFFAVFGADVYDAAAVLQALGIEHAVALDSGGSSNLYFNGRNLVGPSRRVPNAILILPQ